MRQALKVVAIVAAMAVALASSGVAWYVFSAPSVQHLALAHDLIDGTSAQGQQLLTATPAKTDYDQLNPYFVTQSRRAFCGVASSTIVVNAALHRQTPVTQHRHCSRLRHQPCEVSLLFHLVASRSTRSQTSFAPTGYKCRSYMRHNLVLSPSATPPAPRSPNRRPFSSSTTIGQRLSRRVPGIYLRSARTALRRIECLSSMSRHTNTRTRGFLHRSSGMH